MKVRGEMKCKDKNREKGKIVRDLKLVYVCSQYRMLSSLNCRVFFTTLRPERQASNTKPHGLHLNGAYVE